MILNVHHFILILLSIHLTHASVTSRKRKTPASPQQITTRKGHSQLESDTLLQDSLDHRSKRQALEPVENNHSFSLDNDMDIVSPGSGSTPLSSSSQQKGHQLSDKMSAPKSPKNKRPHVLHDETSAVEAVRPEGTLVAMPSIPQEQATPQVNGPVYLPFRLNLKGGEFSCHYQLSELVTGDHDFPPFNETFGDHVIGFRLFRKFNMLFLGFLLSSFTFGQIKARLVGLQELFMESARHNYEALDFARGALINKDALPLGKLEDVQVLEQNNPYIYLMIMVSIAPGECNFTIRHDLLEEMNSNESQKISERIEQLLEEDDYEEIGKLGDSIPVDKFLKHLSPMITSVGQYDGIRDYLGKKQLLAHFFVHANMDFLKELVVENVQYTYDDLDDDEERLRTGDLEIALPIIFERGHFERFVEILEFRRKSVAEVGEVYEEGGKQMQTIQYFVGGFFEDIVHVPNNIALFKRFFALHKKFNIKYPEIIEIFLRELLLSRDFTGPAPNYDKLLEDLVGRPSMFTPTSLCHGFLADSHSDVDQMLNFIKYGWAEAIEMALKGKYILGGERLWRTMTEKFPDRCSGEFPKSDELIAKACSKFPTKLQLEKRWIEKNITKLLTKFERYVLIYELLPKVLWDIMAEYIITWFEDEEDLIPTSNFQLGHNN